MTVVLSLHQVAVVEGFINSVDSQMRLRQEQQKLATISARVDSYEAVEGSSEEVEKVSIELFIPPSAPSDVDSLLRPSLQILKEYNHFDLMAPMRGTSPQEIRQLHLEGALRMKEGKDSRVKVHSMARTAPRVSCERDLRNAFVLRWTSTVSCLPICC